MKNQHPITPFALLDHISARTLMAVEWTSRSTALAIILGSLLVPWSGGRFARGLKVAGFGSASALAGTALLTGHQVRKRRHIAAIVENRAGWAIDESLKRLWHPGEDVLAMPEPPKPLTLFDWELFNSKPGKYPHVFLLGGTGDGKSYLAERLALHTFDGIVVALHPHYEPGDLEGIPTYGVDRNYGSPKDPPADFGGLLDGTEGEVSGFSFMCSLLDEMDRRYRLRSQGKTDYPTVNVVLDEFLALASECPDVADILKKLIREARKVKIRLILLLQGDEVKALKIEGEGSLRKNVRYVRLGDFARDHASRLLNEGKLPQSHYEWLQQQEFPYMVEDQPAQLPPRRERAAIASTSSTTPPNVSPEAREIALDALKLEALLDADFDKLAEEKYGKLMDLSRRKGWISAAYVKQQIFLYRSMSPVAIRQQFRELEAMGYGKLRGIDDKLEWALDPSSEGTDPD